MSGRSHSALGNSLATNRALLPAYIAASIYCGTFFWFVLGWYSSLTIGFGIIVVMMGLFLFWAAFMGRSDYWTVLVVLYGMRIVACFAEPVLSDDLYRYLLDGVAQLSGVSPYAYIPAKLGANTEGWLAPSLTAEPAFIFLDKVNHPELATIYLPASQLYFGASAGLAWLGLGPYAAFRLPVIVFELALLWFTRRRRHLGGAMALLFASPLWLLEAQSIHQETFWVLVWLSLLTFRPSESSRLGAVWLVSWLATASVKPLSALVGFLGFIVPALGPGRIFVRARTWLERPGRLVVLTLLLISSAAYFIFLFQPREAVGNLAHTLSKFTGTFQFNHPLYYYFVFPYRLVSFQLLQAGLIFVFVIVVTCFWVWNFRQGGQLFRSVSQRHTYTLWCSVIFLLALYAGRTAHPWYFLWGYPIIALALGVKKIWGFFLLCLWQMPLLSYYVKIQELFTGVWQTDGKIFLFEAMYAGMVVIFFWFMAKCSKPSLGEV